MSVIGARISLFSPWRLRLGRGIRLSVRDLSPDFVPVSAVNRPSVQPRGTIRRVPHALSF